jgi:hypothetical protein
VADLALQVPKICDVVDLVDQHRDEKIIMTYLSFFRDKSADISAVGLATLIVDDAGLSKSISQVAISPRGTAFENCGYCFLVLLVFCFFRANIC